jgi:cytidylate kinase
LLKTPPKALPAPPPKNNILQYEVDEMKTIITISREFGSGGLEAGQKLAEKLNVPLYHKELWTLTVEGNEQKGKEQQAQLADIPFYIQTENIKKAVQSGPCILIGCCADYVLRDEKNVFSVFIYADKFDRIERIVKKYKMEPEQAAAYIIKKDRERATSYRLNTGETWGEHQNYHLTIDSAVTDAQEIAELIHAAIVKKEAFEKHKSLPFPFAIGAAIV